jgi:hypothetical protein
MAFRITKIHFLFAVFALCYGAFLAWYMCPYAGGSDSSGYLNSAKLLRSGRLAAEPRIPANFPAADFDRGAFTPAGFKAGVTAGEIVPTYAVGLPLQLAAVATLTGFEWAPLAINLLQAAALFWLVRTLARDFGVGPGWSMVAAGVLSLSPLVVLYSLQVMSDLPATVWAVAAVLGGWRSSRHWGWALAAGAAFALAVLVRPSNALLLVPVAIPLGWSWRNWLGFGVGGVPAGIFLSYYNLRLYGTPFTTGYGDVRGMFSLAYVGPTLKHYAAWLPGLLTPFVLAVVGLPFVATDRKVKAVLGAWAGVLLAFYAGYVCTHETWWYLRFVMPAFPALVIGAALVLQRVKFGVMTLAADFRPVESAAASGLRLRLPLIAIAVAAAVTWQVGWARHFGVQHTELGERAYRQLGQWAETAMPANALIAADQTSGALQFYSSRPIIHWDSLDARSYAVLDAYLAANHGVLYAGLFPDEEEHALLQKMPGTWEAAQRFRQVTVWRRVSATPAPLPKLSP